MPSMALSRIRDFDRRHERACNLGERYPAAAEILTFYRRITEFQKQVFHQISPDQPKLQTETSLRGLIDVASAAHQLPALLSIIERAGTPILKEAARELKDMSAAESMTLFEQFTNGVEGMESPAYFCARVCLQPFAEHLAANTEVTPGFGGSACPLCGGRPQLAVLRPEGDGGKRFLLCSFCITEWEFRRVLCPSCGEVDYRKLPRYSADDIPAVRVEACDTCKHYLKSVDLTVEGLAVPVVDEIAAAPLDLWALDRGYKKLQQNVMGF